MALVLLVCYYIKAIGLDKRAEPLTADEDGFVTLKYPPALLLFKPEKKTRLTFPVCHLVLFLWHHPSHRLLWQGKQVKRLKSPGVNLRWLLGMLSQTKNHRVRPSNMWSLTSESHLQDHSHRSQSTWHSREAEEKTQSDSWEILMLICFRIIHLKHWGQTWRGSKSWMTKPRENGWREHETERYELLVLRDKNRSWLPMEPNTSKHRLKTFRRRGRILERTWLATMY